MSVVEELMFDVCARARDHEIENQRNLEAKQVLETYLLDQAPCN